MYPDQYPYNMIQSKAPTVYYKTIEKAAIIKQFNEEAMDAMKKITARVKKEQAEGHHGHHGH